MILSLVITLCAALGRVILASICGFGWRPEHSSSAKIWVPTALALAASVAALALSLVVMISVGGILAWTLLFGALGLTLVSFLLLAVAFVVTDFPRDFSDR